MNKSSIKRKLPNLSISPDNFVYDKPMSNTFLANSTYSPCIFAYFINIRGLIASVPIAEPIERKGLIRVTVALSRSSLANNLPIFLRLWQSPRAQKRAFRVQKYKKYSKWNIHYNTTSIARVLHVARPRVRPNPKGNMQLRSGTKLPEYANKKISIVQ